MLCGTCYIAQQEAGEVTTLPVHDKDTAESFCPCPKCQARRANTLLNAPGLHAHRLDDIADLAETTEDEPQMSADIEMSDVDRFCYELPDWLTPAFLAQSTRAITRRLRLYADRGEAPAVGIIRRLALQIEADPLTHLVRQLTDNERRALASVSFGGIAELNMPQPETDDAPYVPTVSDLHKAMAAVGPAVRQIFGPVFLVPRDDAADFVGDYNHDVVRLFVSLSTQQDAGGDDNLGDFLVDMLGATTLQSFLSTLRMVYFAVHPDALGFNAIAEEEE
jgi:hypothetical protein